MAKKPLSDRQYITRNGLTCPACHKNRVSSARNELYLNRDRVDQEMKILVPHICCDPKCGARWNEQFELTGYRDLTDDEDRVIERMTGIVQPDKKHVWA